MLTKKISRLEKPTPTPTNAITRIRIKKAEYKKIQGKFLTKSEQRLLGLIKSRLGNYKETFRLK
jgi:hypothetical protein